MNSRELFDYIIKKFDGVVIDDFGWEHHTIKNKTYDIRFDPKRLDWSCDCKAFTYRRKFKRKYCKHIIEIQNRKLEYRKSNAKYK